ncbi:MAG: stage III sporulation AC/AD family protein [Oscillospiraceae bacterium]|nr:stage III sporulation AC/AD family protein [Oscillospiraceae bacterium]
MEITEILKITGIGLFAVILAFIFKELKQEYSVMLMIAGGIIITLWGLAKVYPVVDYIRELTDSGNITEYFSVILKVLGISFIVQTGADICRDFGEASVASKIEFAGKAVILVIVLPVLKSVISMGLELLA